MKLLVVLALQKTDSGSNSSGSSSSRRLFGNLDNTGRNFVFEFMCTHTSDKRIIQEHNVLVVVTFTIAYLRLK